MGSLIPLSEVLDTLKECKPKNKSDNNDDYDISIDEAIKLISQIQEVNTVNQIVKFDRMTGAEFRVAFVEPKITKCKHCKYSKNYIDDKEHAYDYFCDNEDSPVFAVDANFGCVLGEERDD